MTSGLINNKNKIYRYVQIITIIIHFYFRCLSENPRVTNGKIVLKIIPGENIHPIYNYTSTIVSFHINVT